MFKINAWPSIEVIIRILMALWLLLSSTKTQPAITQNKSDLPPEENYVPDQVMVKFKPDISLTKDPLGMFHSNNAGLENLLQNPAFHSAKRLFPEAKRPLPGSFQTIAGQIQPAVDLTNIYLLQLSSKADTIAVINNLKANPAVDYAEPNYLAGMTDVPNDPDYGQQWGLTAIHAEQAWTLTHGSAAVTIAVLDTGVDLDHPDLAGKLWTNPGEIPGNGIDDDADGYIDDVNGWDFVNSDNLPQDDNGHGTHVAGIAAAGTNNGTGIAGVCWNCRIMPLKVLQSSGRGSYADIAAAVYYASNKGAKVINMSLGSYVDSNVLRDALAAAYPSSILVAAAGNDHNAGATFFPAAYSFVIGVEAIQQGGSLAYFSNYDPDGPWNVAPGGYTYDLRAPGASIYSTMLDDSYAQYSGTSMAAPFVAGAAGLIISQYPSWSPEKIRAQLVNSAAGVSDSACGVLDVYAAFTQVPAPHLDYVHDSVFIGDANGDHDGIIDAGESITMTLTLNNLGAGEASAVSAQISTSDPYVTMTNAISDFGDISAYAQTNNVSNPFSFSVDANAPNNHDITFQLSVSSNGGAYTRDLGSIVLTVQKGQQISGVFSGDTTLTSDKYYIVTGSLLVPAGITLTIEAGTTIAFNPNTALQVEGTLLARGTTVAPILFTSNSSIKFPGNWGGINFTDSSVDASFDGLGSYLSGSIVQNSLLEYAATAISLHTSAPFIDHNSIRYNTTGLQVLFGATAVRPWIHANRFYGNTVGMTLDQSQVDFTDNVLTENDSALGLWEIMQGAYVGSYDRNVFTRNGSDQRYTIEIATYSGLPSFHDNSIFGNHPKDGYDVYLGLGGDYRVSIADGTDNWWGTTDQAQIAQRIYDNHDDFNVGTFNFEPFLDSPSSVAPPILSGVSLSPSSPVSSEPVTFTLSFSRPMSQTVQPQVAFGVTTPYLQHQVVGSWVDPVTWIGTYPVTVLTGDGINTLRVAGAVDLQGTAIPTDERFQFNIQTAGSSSLMLNADPQYSRVVLDWPASPLTNTLGYNVYRGLSNTVPYTTTPINNQLILQNVFTDTNVVNGTTYYYRYTIVDTDLREVAHSNEVQTVPNDFSPPTTPLVTDEGSCTRSMTTLAANWSANDSESGIAEYQYGIGTSPGSLDVINWTSTGTNTGITRSGLNLMGGVAYYFVVKARNGVGTWSQNGVSDGIMVDPNCPVPTFTQTPVPTATSTSTETSTPTQTPIISTPTPSLTPTVSPVGTPDPTPVNSNPNLFMPVLIGK